MGRVIWGYLGYFATLQVVDSLNFEYDINDNDPAPLTLCTNIGIYKENWNWSRFFSYHSYSVHSLRFSSEIGLQKLNWL